MSELAKTFFMGFMLGMILVAIALGTIPTSTCVMGRKAIAECEKSLPRDQHCVITAIREPK